MNIIETNFKFTSKLSNRSQTDYIILHHRAGNGDAMSIHNQHINRGYSGIGYHYYVMKDGSIYTGRPVETVGAHCLNYNNKSVGICFEGNFEKEQMCEVQKKAGTMLVSFIKDMYPYATIIRHKDKGSTACPGKNFPFNELTTVKALKKELTSPNDIIWELKNGKHKVEINDIDKAVKHLHDAKNQNTSLYWILYKIVNKE